MQSENEVMQTGSLEAAPPDLSIISPKAGWQTSEGQIVAFLSAALAVLAFLGFHFSPEQVQSWMDLLHQVFVIIGPIAGIIGLVWPYIISRGKTKSNAINASALINAATAVQGPPIGQIATLGGIGSLLGGKNWKDPQRYLNIVKDINATGLLPGSPIIGEVLKTTEGNSDEFESEVTQALQQFDQRIKKLEAQH